MAISTFWDDSFNLAATKRSSVPLPVRTGIEAAGSVSLPAAIGTFDPGTDGQCSIGSFAASVSLRRLCPAELGGRSVRAVLQTRTVARAPPNVFGRTPMAGKALCLKRQTVRAAIVEKVLRRIGRRDGCLAGGAARRRARPFAYAHIAVRLQIRSRQLDSV